MSLTGQLAIEFEPGITQRYGSLLECIASGVYQRNLKSIASDLDLPRGNLTVMLSGDGQRHFGVDHLERYIEATGDVTPILYLVAKHLGADSFEKWLGTQFEGTHEVTREDTRKGFRIIKVVRTH